LVERKPCENEVWVVATRPYMEKVLGLTLLAARDPVSLPTCTHIPSQWIHQPYLLFSSEAEATSYLEQMRTYGEFYVSFNVFRALIKIEGKDPCSKRPAKRRSASSTQTSGR